MTEPLASNVVGGIAPDFNEVEKSGVAFDWSWSNVVALNEDRRLLIKTKQMPNEKVKISKWLLTWYIMTVLGAIMSIPILLTLLKQYYFSEGANLFDGVVLGSTFVSACYFAQKIYHLKKRPEGKPRFVVKNLRVGIDKDNLWVCDQNLLSVALSRACIRKVVQIEDVIVCTIGDSASYPFPRQILEASTEGKKVIDWFEANWPASFGSGAYRFQFVQRRWYWRLLRKSFMTLSVFGLVILMTAVLLYINDAWQATQRDQAISNLKSNKKINDGSKSLSGQDAGDFIYHLTHPGMR